MREYINIYHTIIDISKLETNTEKRKTLRSKIKQHVKKILEDNLSRLSSFKQIIIQVNLDVDLLRRWISEKHFTILNEVMVYKKHYYTIIEISTDYHERYSKEEILFGPILIKTKRDVFLNYLNHLLDKYNNIIKNTSDEKKELLNKKIETINKILNK